MNEKDNREGINPEDLVPDPRDARGVGFKENPAPQGLKSPPEIEPGEDSGEWTRGGGTDPNEENQDHGDKS
jgi:hypothetical protein